jgi:L-fuconolactonase
MEYFDTHTHAISPDTTAYPPSPLGGTRSEWSQTRPVDVDGLVRALDDAGVHRAALVHASTVYGFDNSYAADALAQHPDRLVGVCSVDFLADTAVEDLRHWIEERGFSGVRIRVSDGTTKVPTPGAGVADERMAAVWAYVAEHRVPVCIQMHSKDTGKLVTVLERHPDLIILLDHLGRPNATGGPEYPMLDELGALAAYGGVHLKITPPGLKRIDDEPGAETVEVLRRIAGTFGTHRVTWGSNFPASAGTLRELRDRIQSQLTWLDDAALAGVMSTNATRVYDLAAADR